MIKKIFGRIGAIAIPICFVLFNLLNYIFCRLYCGEVSTLSWQFSFCWSLLFCGILTMLPTIGKRIGMVVLIVFFSVTCLVHAVMYNLFGNFFAFSDLLYTEDGMAFFSFSYIKARKLLWATTIGSVFVSLILAINLKKKKYNFKQTIVGLVLIIVAVLGVNSRHNKLMDNVSDSISFNGVVETEGDIYQSMSNKNYAMSITGIYQYLYRSVVVSSGLEHRLNNNEMYDELDDYYANDGIRRHESNEMTGIFKGMNVFFIMLESIDTWMLTEEYMPNLYKVQQESLNFVNHYTPLYLSAGTFNTEFIANTGLIPPSTGINPKVYSENYFPYSIGNCFKERGYSVNSFHGSNPHIYDRGNIHNNLGYSKYHNWEEMGMSNHRLDSQMLNGYPKMVSNFPFFSFVITYSGHGPYTGEARDISEKRMKLVRELASKSSIDISSADLEEYTYSIAYAMETDDFVGGLLQKLEENHHLKDTVLIFFTDHYSKYLTNHDLIRKLKGVEQEELLCNTPFFIYQSEMEAKVIEDVSSTIDIVPTVANLFGLNVNYSYYAGVDVFSEAEHYVMFPGNSWYDGDTFYTANYEGDITSKITQRNKEIARKIKFSEYILKSDYFLHLEKDK